MSASPESTRSRLIREMARDMNRLSKAPISNPKDRSTTNGHETTGSSFDPENEALASTRHLDEPARRLPDLRDSAKKYRYPQTIEPDLQINTSAIHRAFPDFSQGYSSPDESLSIERGRGQPAASQDSRHDFSLIDSHTKARPSGSPRWTGASEKAPSRHRNYLSRRTHSENVTNLTQSSHPAPVPFSNAHNLIEQLNVTKTRPADPRAGPAPPSHQDAKGVSHYSADITDVPNLSELVSGVFEDGTPVFSAGAGRGDSRLPSRRKSRLSHAELASIPTPDEEQAIYISLKLLQEKIVELEEGKVDDAAAIVSLRAENDALIQEKADRQRNKRSDSALGSTSGSDGGDEAGLGGRKAAIERSRLESRLRRVEEELKLANNKLVVSSETIRSITHERDSATNQLGVAYITTERLKAQIQALQDEIEQLKNRPYTDINAEGSQRKRVEDSNGQAAILSRTETYHPTVENEDQDNTELLDFDLNLPHAPPTNSIAPQKKERPTRVVSAASAAEQRPVRSAHGHESRMQRETSHSEVHKVLPRRRVPTRDMSRASHAERILASRLNKPDERLNPQKSRIVLEDYSESEKTDPSIKHNRSVQTKLPRGLRATEFRSGSIGIVQEDLTILSGESGDSIELYPELRGILEQAREEKRNRGWTRIVEPQVVQKEVSRALNTTQPIVQRKSSLKDLSKRLSVPGDAASAEARDDVTGYSKASAHARRHSSDNSMLEQKSRREGFAMEEMTSAYIVPDITIGNTGARPPPKVDTAKPSGGVVDQHMKDCTICHRILGHGQSHDHGSSTKITVPKPVPVSERMPSPSPSNEEPTMRPSEAPGLSLARVIKALNDEIHLLKEKLRTLEQASYEEDPGLSKRQRVERERNIAMLRKAKNQKSDQVYYLMNVLEGQKVAGQEMTEEQVEVTLDQIGIDATHLDSHVPVNSAKEAAVEDSDAEKADDEAADGAMPPVSKPLKSVLKTKKPVAHSWDNLDDTEDLPWEGFETTEDMTGRSGRSNGSRYRVHAS